MLNEQLSEFLGVVVGDGSLSRFWSKSDKRMIFLTSITGSWKNDSEYYRNVVQPIILKEFGLRGYIYHRKDESARFMIKSKAIFEFLKNLGLPIGEKVRIRVPRQRLQDKNLMIGFIRGLFNTDGTVYRRYGKLYGRHKKHYRNYAVIQFKMINRNVIEFVKIALNNLGIKTTKVTIEKGKYYLFRITSQENVDKFFRTMTINHGHHLRRYNEIRQIS